MIKSKVVKKKAKKPVDEFPRLLKSNRGSRLTILFTGVGKGTVVVASSEYDIGHYSEKWSMDFFDTFNGTIKLTNVE